MPLAGQLEAFSMDSSNMISVQEAGKMGGISLLQKRGKIYFSEIGKKGQKAMRIRYPDMAKEWGKKGGRPKKRPI
jgi:hypothetical protein